jgi:hypothetical protein
MGMSMPTEMTLYMDALYKLGLLSAVLQMDGIGGWVDAVDAISAFLNEPYESVEGQIQGAIVWFRSNVVDMGTDIQRGVIAHVLNAYRLDHPQEDNNEGES